MNNHKLLFAIGTNSHRQQNMSQAVGELAKVFGNGMQLTNIIETEAIGLSGPRFLNRMAECTTSLSIHDVNTQMKRIEADCGNTREKRRRGVVEMDIDILEYAGKRYHADDWQRPYIIELLRELGRDDSISMNECDSKDNNTPEKI